MKSITITHKGKRPINQDFILSKSLGSDTFIYLIADGMGGYDSGEIAAKIAIDSVITFLTSIDVKDININSIQKAINKANLAIRQYQEKNNSKLGSTLSGIIIGPQTAKCFWVGDVKIIGFSNDKVVFESKSHNLLNELKSESFSDNALLSSKYEHIVTRSIQGDLKKSVISFEEIDLVNDYEFIICSDGVHGLMDSQTLLYMLKSERSSLGCNLNMINKRLVEEAQDNASLVYIKT